MDLIRSLYRLRDRILYGRSGRRKPWQSKGLGEPAIIHSVSGMLGTEERRALFWIGREYYSGAGAIIDAGAYIGASATCLAAGLAANDKARVGKPVIHSYDFFRAVDPYVANHISEVVRPLEVGEDYLDIYRTQTKPFSRLVDPIQGDFLASRWSNGPIEILFVDVSKTRDLNAHVIREFFPHLIPGRSLLIHQDFYHGWHPYIHVTMEALRDYFIILDGHIQEQTRLYLYTKAIPQDVLKRVADYDFSTEECLALLDELKSREHGDMRAMADVLKIRHLLSEGDFARAEEWHAALVKRYEGVEPKGLWWKQAQEQGEELSCAVR